MLEASFASLFDAAQVRLSQFGQAILTREGFGLDTGPEEMALLDLRFGLEVIAQLPLGTDQDIVIGYLIETYGLLAVGTDPFLRPLLPPVPITGATVRRFVLTINSRAVVANTTLIGMGAELVPVTQMLVTQPIAGLTGYPLTYTATYPATYATYAASNAASSIQPTSVLAGYPITYAVTY